LTSVVLVAGLLESDSGKTVAATALVAGLDAVPFKPRSGFNVWEHYDHAVRCAREFGAPVSLDVVRLLGIVDDGPDPLTANPVHRVWTYPDPGYALSEEVSLRFLSSRTESHVLLDRLGEEVRLYPGLESKFVPLDPGEMCSRCEIVEADESPDPSEVERVVDSAFGGVRGFSDVVVVESLNNLALPWEGCPSEGVAVVVGPGRGLVYDLEEYVRAVSALPEVEPVTVDLVDVLEPEEVVDLPVLEGVEGLGPSDVVEAYSDLVRAVSELL